MGLFDLFRAQGFRWVAFVDANEIGDEWLNRFDPETLVTTA